MPRPGAITTAIGALTHDDTHPCSVTSAIRALRITSRRACFDASVADTLIDPTIVFHPLEK
jgi:hypothetical protein